MINIQAKDLHSGEVIKYTKMNENACGLQITDRGSYPVDIEGVSSDYPIISRGRII